MEITGYISMSLQKMNELNFQRVVEQKLKKTPYRILLNK